MNLTATWLVEITATWSVEIMATREGCVLCNGMTGQMHKRSEYNGWVGIFWWHPMSYFVSCAAETRVKTTSPAMNPETFCCSEVNPSIHVLVMRPSNARTTVVDPVKGSLLRNGIQKKTKQGHITVIDHTRVLHSQTSQLYAQLITVFYDPCNLYSIAGFLIPSGYKLGPLIKFYNVSYK